MYPIVLASRDPTSPCSFCVFFLSSSRVFVRRLLLTVVVHVHGGGGGRWRKLFRWW